MVPLCDMKAVGPGLTTSQNERFKRAADVHRPLQLGPTKRMPLCLERRTNSAWSLAPSAPTSAKPAVMITAPPTFFSTHCRNTSTTWLAFTTMTARSMGPGWD